MTDISREPNLRILLQTNEFCIVDKPVGWLSVPSRMGAGDPRPCVGIELQKQLGLQIYPVHRLDEEVSGILLFALNEMAHKSANAWFEKHLVQKTYQALTAFEAHTHFADDRGFAPILPDELKLESEYTWKSKILRGKRRAYFHSAGKPAETRATAAQKKKVGAKFFAKWELQPVTGRSHQLRIELARHGWPILGDELYGSKDSFRSSGIALHAWKLDMRLVAVEHRGGLPEVFEHPDSLLN